MIISYVCLLLNTAAILVIGGYIIWRVKIQNKLHRMIAIFVLVLVALAYVLYTLIKVNISYSTPEEAYKNSGFQGDVIGTIYSDHYAVVISADKALAYYICEETKDGWRLNPYVDIGDVNVKMIGYIDDYEDVLTCCKYQDSDQIIVFVETGQFQNVQPKDSENSDFTLIEHGYVNLYYTILDHMDDSYDVQLVRR